MLITSVDKGHNTHIATGSKFKLGYLNILEHWIKTKKMKCKVNCKDLNLGPKKSTAYISNRGDLACNIEEGFWGDKNQLTAGHGPQTPTY